MSNQYAKYPNFSLPGGLRWKKELLEINNKFKKKYGFNMCNTVYDSITQLKWSGGRFLIDSFSIEDLIQAAFDFNNIGIGFAFTFTNLNISKEDLEDIDCNYVLKKCHNSLNTIILNSEELAYYIKNKYPKYKIALSATKCLRTSDEINLYYNNNLYDFIVPLSEVTKDKHTLQNIPEKNKLQLIINEKCLYDCPHRKEHYVAINEACCNFREGKPIDEKKYQCHISREDGTIFTSQIDCYALLDLIEQGYNNFKFSGRDNYNGKTVMRDIKLYTYFLAEEFK